MAIATLLAVACMAVPAFADEQAPSSPEGAIVEPQASADSTCALLTYSSSDGKNYLYSCTSSGASTGSLYPTSIENISKVYVSADVPSIKAEYQQYFYYQSSYSYGNNSTSFMGLHSLQNVTFLLNSTGKSSVSSIGSRAFGDLATLQSVANLESTSIVSLPENAFNGDVLLQSVGVPSGLLQMGESCFSGCSALTSVKGFASCSITTLPSYAFQNCTSLGSIKMPGTLTTINTSAFSGCTSLASVDLDANLKTIGYGSFESCVSLGSVSIPSSVSKIDIDAFKGCTSLATLSLGSGLATIGYGAFENCVQLKSVTIPATVTSMGGNSFLNCASLASVYMKSSTPLSSIGGSFDGTPIESGNGWIYVPSGSVDTYKSTYGWQSYKDHITADTTSPNPMYRLYNPNSGEHFFTASSDEKDGLARLGWHYEGVGWTAPATSSTPVYRLYNKNGGEHHYTTSSSEKDSLENAGWKYEGVGWYSDDAEAVPLYRLYNPNAFANNHHYTTDASERDWLKGLGWRYEGVGWYGV